MRMGAKYVTVVTASVRDIPERWAQHYQHRVDGWRQSPLTGGKTAKGIFDELCKLGESPAASKIADIIGNKSWSYVSCDGCPEYVERGVRIGEADDGKVYCEICLKEALHALSGLST